MSLPRSLVTLALAVAWACSEEERPPPFGPSNQGGEAGEGSSGSSGAATGGSGRGGASGQGGTAGTAPGGAAGAAGADAPGGEGGEGGEPSGGTGTGGSSGTGGVPPCPSDSAAGAPPGITALCDPSGAWGPSVDAPLMDGAAQLVAVTPDELTIAYYGYAMMDTLFYVSDRASPAVDFDPGQELEVRDYVTLSPDGLRLVALSDEGRFLELVRTARGQAFGLPSEGSFAMLDAHAAANDLRLAGGAISTDDRAFYYLSIDGTDDQPLRVSRRTGTEPWPVGTEIAGCEFQTHDGLFREPTGVSADGLTLFYYDWVRGRARAAWRETVDGAFVWFVDLGTRNRAQPNADCSRVYFTASSGPAFAEGG